MLRTKDGDENSYKSSDAINNIDWSVLKEGTNEYNMMLYYQELIRIRNTYDIFKANNTEISPVAFEDGRVAIKIIDHARGKSAIVVANPTGEAMTYTLNGNWNMVANGETVMTAPEAVSGTITIPAYSAVILVSDSCLSN